MPVTDLGPTRRMLVADATLDELERHVERVLERHDCGPPCRHWEARARGEARAADAVLRLLHESERQNRPLQWRVAELERAVERLRLQVAELGGDPGAHP